MLFTHSIQTMSFRRWVLWDRESRLLLKLSTILIVVQFILFKFLYPYPNFMPPDSDGYIEAAFYNYSINIWPIGYSKFLRLISSFSSSHYALILFQYILLEACLLYFLYTLRYLLLPGKWLFRVLIVCSVLNPLLPHIANFVSSDALFAALSLIWFTQLLWIIYRPGYQLLVFHSFVLLFAFMVRYNALFYPFISIAVFFLTNLPVRVKLLSTCVVILLLGSFIGHTSYKYYNYIGTAQYSGFGGWLMAANALYGYAHATLDPVEKVPARFQKLHAMVNQHMDSIRDLAPRPDEEVDIYYCWDEKSPLREYLGDRWIGDSTTVFFKRWATMAPLYADYGRFLIERHPVLFAKYYMWPNFVKYYAPPTKFMSLYNLGREDVSPMTAAWFGWEDNRIVPRYRDKAIRITEFFSILIAVINLVFMLSFIAFVCLSGFRRCTPCNKRLLWWMFVIWLCNMGFSVLSAPIEMRYQIFAMIITYPFAALLVECMIREIPDTPKSIV